MLLLGNRENVTPIFEGDLVVALNDRIITNINALAGITLSPSGWLTTISQSGAVVQETEWSTPRSITNGTGFEARVTVVSGSINQGNATDEWLALTSILGWGVQEDGTTRTCTFTLEIRPNGGSAVATATMTVTSEYSA